MTISAGDTAPDFTLTGWSNGAASEFTLSAERGHPVVLAFYPADSSAVCTRQMCSYNDDLSTFAHLDARVWGISTQDLASKERFAQKQGLTFPLLADVDHVAARAYGVDSKLGTKRSIFVIDAEGKVAYAHVATVGLLYQRTEKIAKVLADLRPGSATVEA